MKRDSLNDPETEFETARSKRKCESEKDGKKSPKSVRPRSRLTYNKPLRMVLKTTEPITIGSCLERAGEKNYIYLEGDRISEEHAKMTLDDSDFIHVHDMDSTYGIVVDEDLIPKGYDDMVRGGYMIKLGLQLPLEEVQFLRSVQESSTCMSLKIEYAPVAYNIFLNVHHHGMDEHGIYEQKISLELIKPEMKEPTKIRLITDSMEEQIW
ncbi:hypothetical protein OXX59_007440 [Metschnikowia pulcherrima]